MRNWTIVVLIIVVGIIGFVAIGMTCEDSPAPAPNPPAVSVDAGYDGEGGDNPGIHTIDCPQWINGTKQECVEYSD